MAQLAQSPIKPDVDYFQRCREGDPVEAHRAARDRSRSSAATARTSSPTAIAKLSHATAQRLDLGASGSEQALDDGVEDALVELSHLAWKVLVEIAPPGANITEWAKQEQCWRAMRSESMDVELAVLENWNPAPFWQVGDSGREPQTA